MHKGLFHFGIFRADGAQGDFPPIGQHHMPRQVRRVGVNRHVRITRQAGVQLGQFNARIHRHHAQLAGHQRVNVQSGNLRQFAHHL